MEERENRACVVFYDITWTISYRDCAKITYKLLKYRFKMNLSHLFFKQVRREEIMLSYDHTILIRAISSI